MFVFTTKGVSSIAELFKLPKLLSHLNSEMGNQQCPDLKPTTTLGNRNLLENPQHQRKAYWEGAL